MARSFTTTADMSGLDEYDYLIYPGYMRRPMARWNEDGSVAPMARARGPKGEAFQCTLKQSEIDEDIAHIEYEVRALHTPHESHPRPKRVPKTLRVVVTGADHARTSSHGARARPNRAEIPEVFSPGHVRWFPSPASHIKSFLPPRRTTDLTAVPATQIGIGKKPKKKRTGPPINPKLEAVKKQEEEEKAASESEKEGEEGEK